MTRTQFILLLFLIASFIFIGCEQSQASKSNELKDSIIINIKNDDLQFYGALLSSSITDGTYFKTRLLRARSDNTWDIIIIYNKDVKK